MASVRLAVKAMCVQCMGGASVPGLRTEIRGCTAKACPLYPWRPYRWKGELTPAQVAHAARNGGFPADSDAPIDADDSDASEEGSDSDASGEA